MNTSPDHPDFTALALGEHISGTPTQAVLEALRTNVAARREAEQIRAAAGSLAFVLKGQPPQGLDEARRRAILHADSAAVRARFAAEESAASARESVAPAVRRRHLWLYPGIVAAAAAVAGFFVLRVLPGYSTPAQNSNDPVANSEAGAEPNGKIMVTPASVKDAAKPYSHRTPPPGIVDRSAAVPAPEKDPMPAPEEKVLVKDSPLQLPVLPAPAPASPKSLPAGGTHPKLDPAANYATPPAVKPPKRR